MIKYTTKELARIINAGQLGMQGEEELLLFRPEDSHNPLVKVLEEFSNWSFVRHFDYVLQAYPTLENYLALKDCGLNYVPTTKVYNWLVRIQGKENYLFNWSQVDTLFDYQKEGAKFLTLHNRAMLSLSPGLGKTLTSAYAAGLKNFSKILVVCPASLLFYWKGELEKWTDKLPKKPCVEIWHRKIGAGGDACLDEINTCFWAITNPETVAKHSNKIEIEFDCLIVDESIMYKHRDSQRSKALKELARSIPVVWFLTGAPATRYLDDMWHQFHILKPKGYPSYWRFARQYCVVEDDEWGSKVVANARNGEREIKRNFSDIYFSRTQDDVANIPDWIMEDIDIPMYPAQSKAYDTLREELYVKLDSVNPNDIITVDNHLSLMIRSVQIASNPLLLGGIDSTGKWDALPELMKIYPGPYIVWVNFIETGEILRDRFARGDYKLDGKIARVVLANGSTPMEDRNKMVNAMQNGELDVIILNNQVGKFGFTLTKARTAFFVERMYDDSYFQCLHRNRRIGTEQSPIIVNMRSVTDDGKRTIDHLIHSTLDYRVGMIKKVTAGELRKVFER